MIKKWSLLKKNMHTNNQFFAINKKNNLCSISFGHYDIVMPQTVSPKMIVPSHIKKPTYGFFNEYVLKKIEIKNEEQIDNMRKSCILAREILKQAKDLLRPGITTDEIDKIIHSKIISNGAYPSPLNYNGFPKSICTSINNVAAHGIPDDRTLKDGDIINIDLTVYLNDYHGDCSNTFEVGNVDSEGKRLIQVTNECLENAIKICIPGQHLCKIGKIIEKIAKSHGYNVIPSLAGHGIGNYFHGLPDIYHHDNDFHGIMLDGMTFTIEPAITQGSPEVIILEDGWTVITTDNARTAQAEHTILITNSGYDVLT